MLQWRAKDAERGVAEELVDETSVFLDGVNDDSEELVEQADDFAGRVRRGQLGRAHQIDEQHRDIAFLAAQFGTALQSPACDVLTDVPAEQVAHALAFAQLAHHVVESGLQQSQLAGVIDLHVGVVVPALHLAESPAQLSQRIGNRHCRQDVSGQTDYQCGDGHQQNRDEHAVS